MSQRALVESTCAKSDWPDSDAGYICIKAIKWVILASISQAALKPHLHVIRFARLRKFVSRGPNVSVIQAMQANVPTVDQSFKTEQGSSEHGKANQLFS